MRFSLFLLLVTLVLPAVAQAAETFRLDPIFVSRFHPTRADLEDESALVRQLVINELEHEFIVAGSEGVTDSEGTPIDIYLRSCPPQDLYACSFVVGERAASDWVLTGQVDETDGEYEVVVYILDIDEARMIYGFSVVVADLGNELFYKGIREMMRHIISGAADIRDIRGEITDERAAFDQEKERRAMMAASLRDLQEDLGAMEREVSDAKLQDPRLTMDDLKEYDVRDDAPPWERFQMKRREYIRFENSGLTLEEWRRRKKGRSGQLVIGIGGSLGTGPWGEEFDARWVRDSSNAEIVELSAFQELEREMSGGWELSVGMGFLRWFDLSFRMQQRSTRYQYVFHSETLDSVIAPTTPTPIVVPRGTWQWSGVFRFVPMPTSVVRPTASLGASYWKGKAIYQVSELPSQIDDFPTFSAPQFVLVEGGVGIEGDVSKILTLYADFWAGFPVSSQFQWTHHEGIQELTIPGTMDGGAVASFQGNVGLRIRLGPWW